MARPCRPASRSWALAPSRDHRHARIVAPFLPAAVVGPHIVVAERVQHEMRERRAHATLAVRDRRGLGAEARVGVEVLQLVRVAEHPVVRERVLPEDVHRTRDVAAARSALLLAGELALATHVEQPRVAAADRGEALVPRYDDA